VGLEVEVEMGLGGDGTNLENETRSLDVGGGDELEAQCPGLIFNRKLRSNQVLKRHMTDKLRHDDKNC